MQFTHRDVGPKRGIGNGFIPGVRGLHATRVEILNVRPKRRLVATMSPSELPPTLEGVLKKILHEIADGV